MRFTSPHGYDGRINDKLGRILQRQTEFLSWHINCLAQSRLPGTDSLSPSSQEVPCDSQEGQHGGGIPHKSPRGFTVVHPECHLLLWSQDKFLSLRAVHVLGILNLAADFFVEAETQAGGMDAEPSDSSPDLGSVRRSGSGPLYIPGVIPMPALVLPEFPGTFGHRHVCPSLAKHETVRISASQANSGSPVQGEGERCPSPTCSPVLAIPDVILRVDSSSVSAPFGDSNQAGPALSVRARSGILSPRSGRCFGAGLHGLATSKHRVRDVISLAYEVRGLPSPLSIRAHSTRSVASSQALFSGFLLEDICVVAGCSSPHTFIRFYNLDL